MPADRLLGQHLQTLESNDPVDVSKIYATATHLLTTLTNPLNLTLLTHHLLTSSALWSSPFVEKDLHHTLRFISIFQSAASRIVRHEQEHREREEKRVPQPPVPPGQSPIGGGLSRDEWLHSILKGADGRSPVAHHVLGFAGLLIGFCSQERNGLTKRLRAKLENALVRALNLSLQTVGDDDFMAGSIALALNYSFELLSDLERARIDYDRLLPALVGSAFFSSDGYESGRFPEAIDPDLKQSVTEHTKLLWPPQSASYLQLQSLSKRPLVMAVGPMSRLISHTIVNLNQSQLILTAMDDLLSYCHSLSNVWRSCALSSNLSPQQTTDLLWNTFRTNLFAITIILRGVLTRLLNDRALSNDQTAPQIASQTLNMLRALYFILTDQSTPSSFSQYTFVNLTAIDILSAYPETTTSFLASIRPVPHSTHPVDRADLLFYLNTAEHLTLSLPTSQTTPLIEVLTPHLTASPLSADPPEVGKDLSLAIFESSHSLLLSLLSVPHNWQLAETHIPFYTDQLLGLFPDRIQPRQFRLAMKTLVSVASPPNVLGSRDPEMVGGLLELLRFRAFSTQARPAPYATPTNTGAGGEERTSPIATLVLTLIDCLPGLSTSLLLEWLPLIAELLSRDVVYKDSERQTCQSRFWECISGGEMDVERAGLCVMWWGTMGGREMVLSGGHPQDEAMMSGALVNEPEAKL